MNCDTTNNLVIQLSMVSIHKPHVRYGRRLLKAAAMLAIFLPALLMPLLVDVPSAVIVIFSALAMLSFVRHVAMMSDHIVEVQLDEGSAFVRYYRYDKLQIASVSNWSQQVKVVQRFSKYSSYLLRIQTDGGQVIRQYEVCGWSVSDYDRLSGGTNSDRGKQIRAFLLIIVAGCSLILAMDRCTSQQKAVVCDSEWKAFERPLAGVVRVTWPLSRRSSDYVCSVVDEYSGNTIEINSIEFRTVALDGDMVVKMANDACIEIHRRDSILRVVGVQPSHSCMSAWEKQHPERINAYVESTKKVGKRRRE